MERESALTADSELLKRMGAGDLAAAGALYDRYAAVLLAVALRILRDRAEAEDLVHDAFVLASERADHYVAERGSAGAWLVTLARNLSIDRRRRRERRDAIDRRVLAHEPVAIQAQPAADPEAHVLGAREGRRMREALGSLPEPQRATLERAFFDGLSYPEIAEMDGVPLGTVKSRIARGLLALRASLEVER